MRFTKEQKISLALKVRDKKTQLFGRQSGCGASNTSSITHRVKQEAWTQIFNELAEEGIRIDSLIDLRHNVWPNIVKRTQKKFRESRNTGASGSSLDELDQVVLDVIGRESPLLMPLGMRDVGVRMEPPTPHVIEVCLATDDHGSEEVQDTQDEAPPHLVDNELPDIPSIYVLASVSNSPNANRTATVANQIQPPASLQALEANVPPAPFALAAAMLPATNTPKSTANTNRRSPMPFALGAAMLPAANTSTSNTSTANTSTANTNRRTPAPLALAAEMLPDANTNRRPRARTQRGQQDDLQRALLQHRTSRGLLENEHLKSAIALNNILAEKAKLEMAYIRQKMYRNSPY